MCGTRLLFPVIMIPTQKNLLSKVTISYIGFNIIVFSSTSIHIDIMVTYIVIARATRCILRPSTVSPINTTVSPISLFSSSSPHPSFFSHLSFPILHIHLHRPPSPISTHPSIIITCLFSSSSPFSCHRPLFTHPLPPSSIDGSRTTGCWG